VAALLALSLVAACGSDGEADARLAARRAALGLPEDPVPVSEAMARLREKGYEGLLARAQLGSKALRPDEVLDAALEIESLLSRADPSTAAARPPDPPGFDARLAAARGKATDLARAIAAGKPGEREAGDLVASCLDCHVTFRIPR
ncbi:MAG: hypothetical protein L6Q95_19365, partial [Planctomycetes bacterium]|nr:hypothetical protein [Planctomycetota bacterium]